jgi:hypothetical protein
MDWFSLLATLVKKRGRQSELCGKRVARVLWMRVLLFQACTVSGWRASGNGFMVLFVMELQVSALLL